MYHALLWIIRGQPGHWTYVADGLSHKLVGSDWLTRNSLSPNAPGIGQIIAICNNREL